MRVLLIRVGAILLAAAASAAEAAPNIPPSDLPGRERYRFTPSPLDRFMQPLPPSEPLIRWPCGEGTKQRRARRSRQC